VAIAGVIRSVLRTLRKLRHYRKSKTAYLSPAMGL
jgi:hypothetical protein